MGSKVKDGTEAGQKAPTVIQTFVLTAGVEVLVDSTASRILSVPDDSLSFLFPRAF